MKKLVTIITLLLLLSSCQFINDYLDSLNKKTESPELDQLPPSDYNPVFLL